MSIRFATEADLDAITEVTVATLPMGAHTWYLFPHLKQYPEDYYKFTRLRYVEALKEPHVAVMVYECPSIEDPSVKKLAAFSVWGLPGGHTLKPAVAVSQAGEEITPLPKDHADPSSPKTERRDAHPVRMAEFFKNLLKAKAEWFDAKYGEKQISLRNLATHPDYQRRGAGGMLTQWGLDKAKADGLGTTLFASPSGKPLYTKLGFKEVGSFRTQIEGEEEFILVPAMTLDLIDSEA